MAAIHFLTYRKFFFSSIKMIFYQLSVCIITFYYFPFHRFCQWVGAGLIGNHANFVCHGTREMPQKCIKPSQSNLSSCYCMWEKLYGHYLHSLVCHTPIQHCIICSRSISTEQQERHFNTFESISLATSSRWPREITTPGLTRMQAEMKQGEINRQSATQEQKSWLGKLLKCLSKSRK